MILRAATGEVVKIFKVANATNYQFPALSMLMNTLQRTFVVFQVNATTRTLDLHMYDLTSATPLTAKASKLMGYAYVK